ncbi:bone morphogenetic protein 3 [Carlito syrichta]|uniref:Bone morphogenetic protein 3 n=1 Tax=Carlito syrichta TaxID=1868482 RepID=A0A3Q0EHE4_CARSF|nr:bone morphogenetic protein 3 [Carlito syrichta]
MDVQEKVVGKNDDGIGAGKKKTLKGESQGQKTMSSLRAPRSDAAPSAAGVRVPNAALPPSIPKNKTGRYDADGSRNPRAARRDLRSFGASREVRTATWKATCRVRPASETAAGASGERAVGPPPRAPGSLQDPRHFFGHPPPGGAARDLSPPQRLPRGPQSGHTRISSGVWESPTFKSEVRGRNGEKKAGAEAGGGWRNDWEWERGDTLRPAEPSCPGCLEASGYLVLLISKSVRGNPLGLSFSRVCQEMKDAVCINKLDTFSNPECLTFTTYGLLWTEDATNFNGRLHVENFPSLKTICVSQHKGTLESKGLHIFNLTSLTKSENILSATLYFCGGELVNISLSCPMSQECSHHTQRKHIQIDLSAWILKSSRNQSQLLGHLAVDVTKPHQEIMSWLSKDITQLLRKAKENGEFLIGFNITYKGHQLSKRMLSFPEPYILVYANDAAIAEPESVVSSLQGHRNFPKLGSHIRVALSTERRKKRSTGVLLPLQNNELPGAEYQYKKDGVWEERKPYQTLQTQPPEKSKNKKKQRKGPHEKSQTLQFDEQTLKKARRKQWIEPRNCARRYLKVDFADIGWSEWIISPKSFDAYYCSGACQFPMPKSLKPSNHATIQSIVRAVGVVPGIPEPCCVPEKMSSLSILFFDENKNVVLKVYPNMTVESCACR